MVLAANEYFNKQSQLSSGNSEHAAPPSIVIRKAAPLVGLFFTTNCFFFADYEATQQQQFDGSKHIYRAHHRGAHRRLFLADNLHHL